MKQSAEIRAVVVAGVAGVGKTTVGKALADSLAWDFKDADDLHPKENVEKMASGTPLTDSERRPWLERVRSYLDKATDQGKFTVMACSALRRSYAELLTRRRPHFRLAVLRVDPKLLAERLLQRKEHFFPAQLLSSQLAILELPAPDQVFDGSKPAREVALAIIKRYGLER